MYNYDNKPHNTNILTSKIVKFTTNKMKQLSHLSTIVSLLYYIKGADVD